MSLYLECERAIDRSHAEEYRGAMKLMFGAYDWIRVEHDDCRAAEMYRGLVRLLELPWMHEFEGWAREIAYDAVGGFDPHEAPEQT
jgi:hypothetical protein